MNRKDQCGFRWQSETDGLVCECLRKKKHKENHVCFCGNETSNREEEKEK
jgi:hypothetical protein